MFMYASKGSLIYSSKSFWRKPFLSLSN